MAQLNEWLERWISGGVIDDATADRIRQFERDRAREQAESEDDRPGVIEVLLYLGVAVLAVGVFALLAQNWPELESGARLAALAVPAALCLAAGGLMRVSPEAGIRRAGQIAWLVAVGLAAGSLAVYLNEFEPSVFERDDERAAVLAVAGLSAGIALVLWALSPSHPQVLALAGSSVFLAQALGNWPDDFSEWIAGMTMLAIGGAAIALTELKLMQPRDSSQLLFGLIAVAGPYQAGFIDEGMPFELLAFGVGLGLVALGITRSSFIYVLAGVTGVFVALVTFIFEHFEDDIGAPLALILSGGILIGAVLLLARFRPALRRRQPA